MNSFKQLWSNLRTSFWFLPSLIVLFCIFLAVGLIELDLSMGDKLVNKWPRLFAADPEGAREMMSTIAGSMMTVVGVVFSMVLVVLTLAASQYSSRILRNFMRSRITQVILGIYAGIFVYCLILLRTVRNLEGNSFVPELAVFFSFVLALGGIGALVVFIHHISSSIQVSEILASVAHETFKTVDHLFPENLGQGPDKDDDEEVSKTLIDSDWHKVLCKKTGYIQSVNTKALLQIAKDTNIIIWMRHEIGQFVDQNSELLWVTGPEGPDEKTLKLFEGTFGINKHRTIEQDPDFGIRQIVDIALKGLSPGINDVTSAVMCLDYLTAILKKLASRRIPSAFRYDNSELRVIAKGPDFESLAAKSFDQIRASAEGNITILTRIIDAIEDIALVKSNAHRRAVLSGHLDRVDELAKSCLKFEADIEKIEERLSAARRALVQDT